MQPQELRALMNSSLALFASSRASALAASPSSPLPRACFKVLWYILLCKFLRSRHELVDRGLVGVAGDLPQGLCFCWAFFVGVFVGVLTGAADSERSCAAAAGFFFVDFALPPCSLRAASTICFCPPTRAGTGGDLFAMSIKHWSGSMSLSASATTEPCDQQLSVAPFRDHTN